MKSTHASGCVDYRLPYVFIPLNVALKPSFYVSENEPRESSRYETSSQTSITQYQYFSYKQSNNEGSGYKR